MSAGQFGENLTTQGLDLTGTLVGERWRIGGTVVQATSPRIPCATFAHRMGEPKWVKRFTARGAAGTYLRVVVPGEISAGDRIEVIRRPRHTVTIGGMPARPAERDDRGPSAAVAARLSWRTWLAAAVRAEGARASRPAAAVS
ncbi:MAG TPA: MOSC domain-containing protein [Streptosporangiaceae bacterium]|nr:MOSC domain-containing protein [Streptosporangiaceae bacterium]